MCCVVRRQINVVARYYRHPKVVIHILEAYFHRRVESLCCIAVFLSAMELCALR